jgi:LysR family transcriptional regulator, benzoate and cis,cis-muconate-responsive activator of ben and cat genes
LFERGSRNVALTPQGEALVEPIRGLVGYANRIERLIEHMRTGLSRALLIAATIYSEQPERTALISAFAEAYPNEEFELQSSYTAALDQGLLDGEFDMAATVGPPPDERFDWIPLRWFPVDLVVPATSELAMLHKGPLPAEALRGVWLSSFRRKTHPAFYQKLIEPLAALGAHVSYSPDQSPAGQLAYAALHNMVIPTGFVHYNDDDLRARGMLLRRLDIEPIAALMLVRARGTKTQAGERFWEFARRWASREASPLDAARE